MAKRKSEPVTTSNIKIRLDRLKNRFNILTFLSEGGVEWACTAIDPTNDDNWNHDSCLACYESGKNN